MSFPLRKQSRLVLVEYARHLDKFREIESLFLQALFHTSYSYSHLWEIFSQMWEELIQKVERNGKMKYVSINKDYFKQMYQPQV